MSRLSVLKVMTLQVFFIVVAFMVFDGLSMMLFANFLCRNDGIIESR